MRTRSALGTAALVATAVLVGLAPARAGGQTCAVIGDSLTRQDGAGWFNVSRALRAEQKCEGGLYFWGVSHKRVGAPDRLGTTTLDNVEQARRKLGRVDSWLIALGTNDAKGTDEELREAATAVLDAIGPEEQVDWVNVGIYAPDSPAAARVDAVLREVVAGRSNVDYNDWNAHIHSPEVRREEHWLLEAHDYVHMSPSGYDVRAAYYAAILG